MFNHIKGLYRKVRRKSSNPPNGPHARLKAKFVTMEMIRVMRLVAASAVNTLIGLLVIIFLYKLTVNPFLTLILSAAVGYFYSIFSYNAIGFGRGIRRPPYVRYMVVYGSGFVMNAVLTKFGLTLTRNFFLIQLFILPTVVILQWLSSYFWAFRSKD